MIARHNELHDTSHAGKAGDGVTRSAYWIDQEGSSVGDAGSDQTSSNARSSNGNSLSGMRRASTCAMVSPASAYSAGLLFGKPTPVAGAPALILVGSASRRPCGSDEPGA